MRRNLSAAAVAVAIALALVTAPVSLARYTDGVAVAASFAADTLAPPTAVAVPGAIGLTATLTWTITNDAYASGYNLYRSTTSGSGFILVKAVTPRGATTTTDTPLVPGTYYYVLRSYVGNWLSATSNQVSILLI